MQAWQRRALVAAVIAEGIYIGHPQHRWNDLRKFVGETLPRNLSELVEPRGGERVLPPPVQDMLTLLRDQGVRGYRVSPRIAKDPLISQRVLEGAWPIRPDDDAPWYLAYAADALPDRCQPYARQEDIVLAHCP